MGNLGVSTNPAASDRAARTSRWGHGASGLTWSGVTGETPPQSSMPAARMAASLPGDRFGGAWRWTVGPSTIRAVATVASRSSSDGSAASRIAVSGLARKFWTITSWRWP